VTQDLRLELNPEAYPAIEASCQVVRKVIQENHVVYGINTGFGLLAAVKIDSHQLHELQKSLVLSHAAGTGPLLSDRVVKLILLLKINSLARGYSGVRPEIIDALIACYNHEIYPCIPSKGSVGASGDLAPLAHLSLLLLGEGEVHYQGRIIPAREALKLMGLSAFTLAPKEGLALLNGTQVSTALAIDALLQTETLFSAALILGSLSVDAALGSDTPFDERIQMVRGQKGQIEVAGIYRQVLDGSDIRQSHRNCSRVQDPYSLRCQPQVMGAILDQLSFVKQILQIEANAVSDNPLVFSDSEAVLSGGNFHAEPIAFAADNMALAIAEIGALSERRTALLIDPHLNGGLPAFLVQDPGLNSGFMIAQVTAAALASENKSLAHPASVDSIPTSANQEDHVSMATFAARRLQEMVDNTAAILAIEWLAAAQGIDLRAPLKTSEILQQAQGLLRQHVPFYKQDRYFAPDIEKAKNLLMAGNLNPLLERQLTEMVLSENVS
jgi:histidine ammonia-lyase